MEQQFSKEQMDQGVVTQVNESLYCDKCTEPVDQLENCEIW